MSRAARYIGIEMHGALQKCREALEAAERQGRKMAELYPADDDDRAALREMLRRFDGVRAGLDASSLPEGTHNS